ncbi:MAG: ACT domain-containing protein [Bacillota bacterium]
MKAKQLTLIPLDIPLAICRLPASADIPEWADQNLDFLSLTYTATELSIVCPTNIVPQDMECEADWRALKVKGKLDFNLTGILTSIATPLADSEISIFALSTYNTDYVLVKEDNLDKALEVLNRDFKIENE